MILYDHLFDLRGEISAMDATSRSTLHRVLGECHEIIVAYTGNEADVYAVARRLGVKIASDTDLALAVVRVVFGGDDRKRESSYAASLRAAKANEDRVAALGMAKWITDNGGVEAIRRANAKKKNTEGDDKPEGKSLQERRALGMQVARKGLTQPIATVPASALTTVRPTQEGLLVMLGYRDPATNDIAVVGCDTNDERITQLLALLGDSLETIEVERSAKSLDTALEQAAQTKDDEPAQVVDATETEEA
jgi:hypothetical protein